MAKDRFIASNKEGRLTGTRLITDSETGVQYLFAFDGYAGGLTVLVDRDGKPFSSKAPRTPYDKVNNNGNTINQTTKTQHLLNNSNRKHTKDKLH